jgi:hypothetical protein
MGSAAQPTLTSSLLADGRDLSARVDRLLHGAPEASERRRPVLVMAAGFMFTASLFAVMLHPATLRGVHLLLEHLVD